MLWSEVFHNYFSTSPTQCRQWMKFVMGYFVGISSAAIFHLYRRWDFRLSVTLNLIDIMLSMRPSRLHLRDHHAEELNEYRKKYTENSLGPVTPVKSIQNIEISSLGGYKIPLIVYSPETTIGKVPILVYLHGGGFVLGNAKYYEPITTYLAKNTSSIVVAVDYRKAPEHKFPSGVEDCLSAIRWVHSHADEFNADASRMAVLGDSAGGNLAIIASIELRDILSMAVPIYPVVTFGMHSDSKVTHANAPILKSVAMDWFSVRYFRGFNDYLHKLANPLVRSNEELSKVPYTHVITAEIDPLVDEGIEYVKRLREAGAHKVSYANYNDTVHGFFGVEIVTHGRAAIDDVCKLINEHFALII